jgi:hypothetical protein
LFHIQTEVLPKFIDETEPGKYCRQILLNELNSHDSHDVLHTSLAYAFVSKYLPAEAKTLNERQLLSSLVLKSLQRLIKYEKLETEEDFQACKKYHTFLVFTPLAIDFLHGKIASAEELISMYLARIEDLEKASLSMRGWKQRLVSFIRSSELISRNISDEAAREIIEKALTRLHEIDRHQPPA